MTHDAGNALIHSKVRARMQRLLSKLLWTGGRNSIMLHSHPLMFPTLNPYYTIQALN